ncbi:SMP-30/gluconolactonase/LRE family protein [Mesorhizobium sp. CO1-1-9]|uniref:SMP-30/gluconolactonase/LRE family protein n=1 Tax=Mesorhizobium sp. CO1-1-9 TaxID=2876630 RepID=UPI001CCB1165|nr:SMP-30/gluconolactonase/LRE family protein [Mesorhizobium sp. CO1-1-9]MBZ9694944.1 SMP-30/gluconolactonase/LRE family protein [Mesorhizobium sp. CO1-1-9]
MHGIAIDGSSTVKESTNMTKRAECLVDCKNTLGESVFCDPRDNCIYWTDIEQARIYKLDEIGRVHQFDLPQPAAFILPRRRPGFVLGFLDRIVSSNADMTQFDTLAVVEPDLPQTRVNDATVDHQGGIVFGTMDNRDWKPAGSFYRLDPSGRLEKLLNGITVSNGLAISADGAVLYLTDTRDGAIRRFSLTNGFANWRELTPLADRDIAPGGPDGAKLDVEGCYWSARAFGGCVVRISADGKLIEQIELDVKGPTCLAFGGPDMMTLYITTLRLRHTPEELEAAPTAGGLYTCRVGVPGLPVRLALL